jgi:hypothetical protein
MFAEKIEQEGRKERRKGGRERRRKAVFKKKIFRFKQYHIHNSYFQNPQTRLKHANYIFINKLLIKIIIRTRYYYAQLS